MRWRPKCRLPGRRHWATDAAEGSDLSATSGTVTFAANSAAGATQTITITATDDNVVRNRQKGSR